MDELTDRRSADLLARFVRGDARAFQELYELHEHSVRSLVWNVVGRADESRLDDLSQKTWMAVMESAATFEQGRCFRFWLGGVARNICLKDLRERRRDRGKPEAGERTDEETPFTDRAAVRADVRAALAELPAEEREILILRSGEGRTLAEIAERVRLPLKTVHDRFNKAMNRLRPRLKAWGAPLPPERRYT